LPEVVEVVHLFQVVVLAAQVVAVVCSQVHLR
jgi:hypothetical protein